MQNVSVVVCQNAEKYDADLDFAAWVRGIARRQAIMKYREDVKTPVLLEPAQIEQVALAFEENAGLHSPNERMEALEACLGKAPGRSRELIRLRYGESMPLESIARRVGMGAEGVRKALYRCRQELRVCVETQLAASNRGV